MHINVIIPCYNEKPFIEQCVRAIYKNKLPIDCKISVNIVDGMSNDGTREVITQLIEQYPSLKMIDNSQKFTPYAFNLGIKEIEADFHQIVGARHILSENYLVRALEILQNDPTIWCVGGKIINEYINTKGKVIALVMSTSLGVGMGNFRVLQKSGFTDTVTSPMYPAWVFDKIGYFDENLVRNQDDDFNFRVTKAGGKIYYEHEIALKYYVRGDFKKLKKQYFQYGYWKVYVNKKHHTITTFRQVIPPLFVLYSILVGISILSSAIIGSISLIPMIVYISLIAYVSHDLSKKEDLNFWDVLKTFPIIHYSYGMGYLKGVWHFIIRKKKPSDKEKMVSR